MPTLSFLALDTHCKPTILAPGKQSTSYYILVSINVLYSSAILISHITQSAFFITSCNVFGSKASAPSISMEKHQTFFQFFSSTAVIA